MTELRPRFTMHWRRAVLFGSSLPLVLAAVGCGKSVDAPVVPTQLVLTTNAARTVNGLVFSTQPVVAVRDAAGNAMSNYNGVVTMRVSAGLTVFGSASATAVRGIATFNGAGITLTFSSGSLRSAMQVVGLPVAFKRFRTDINIGVVRQTIWAWTDASWKASPARRATRSTGSRAIPPSAMSSTRPRNT